MVFLRESIDKPKFYRYNIYTLKERKNVADQRNRYYRRKK